MYSKLVVKQEEKPVAYKHVDYLDYYGVLKYNVLYNAQP